MIVVVYPFLVSVNSRLQTGGTESSWLRLNGVGCGIIESALFIFGLDLSRTPIPKSCFARRLRRRVGVKVDAGSFGLGSCAPP